MVPFSAAKNIKMYPLFRGQPSEHVVIKFVFPRLIPDWVEAYPEPDSSSDSEEEDEEQEQEQVTLPPCE